MAGRWFHRFARRPVRRPVPTVRPRLAVLEDRTVPAIITVTGTGDTIANDGVVTLREAITAATSNAASGDAPAGDVGLDTIRFAIAGNGLHTIHLTDTLPVISEPLVIDGYSQPGAFGNVSAAGSNATLKIELDGSALNGGQAALLITAGDSTVEGLVVNGAAAGFGIALATNGHNVIRGCYIGTNADGTAAVPNNLGVLVSGSEGNTIGGAAIADRNVISGNGLAGIGIASGSLSNHIFGNLIGTNAAGTAAVGNAGQGIYSVDASNGTKIGGINPGEGNVIAGNATSVGGMGGIFIDGGAASRIQGNRIGVGATGLAIGNGHAGVLVQDPDGLTIGGPLPGAANVIANSDGPGVATTGTPGAGVEISYNSIHDNAGLGIDLHDDGPDLIDPAAALNKPVIQKVVAAKGGVIVNGMVTGPAGTSVVVAIYSTPTGDASGFGEGQTFLTSKLVPVNVPFSIPVAGATGSLAATAADSATGNTTEFGNSQAAPTATFLTAVGKGHGAEPRVTVYNPDGSMKFSFLAYDKSFAGGVRVATGDVDGDGVSDIITGAGAGGGPHVRVFSGVDGSLLREFYAYSADFKGGVFVAAGDIDGDGKADIVSGAGAGGAPHVRAFADTPGTLLADFYAYDASFKGGVCVAAGDVTGDGKADIVTGAGAGGAPHVKVVDLALGKVVRSFYAYDAKYAGGVSVAAGDVTGDAVADVVTGPSSNAAAYVRVFDGKFQGKAQEVLAYDGTFTGGAAVATADVDGDGKVDIVTGAGAGGKPDVRAFRESDGKLLKDFLAADPGFMGGVFVG